MSGIILPFIQCWKLSNLSSTIAFDFRHVSTKQRNWFSTVSFKMSKHRIFNKYKSSKYLIICKG